VLVVGAGPIGNVLGQVLRADGARVLLTDVSDFRLDVARQCRLELVANTRRETLASAAAAAFGEDGFDVAFDCAGVEEALTDAIANVQKGGVIVLVAVYGGPIRMNTALIQDRELSVRGTLMYQYKDFVRAVELIESGEVVTGPLETEHFPLDSYAEAYAFIDQSRDRTMKVFIDV
jgi:threonine dehydrogenase-like Zn-dependent dehydrogenase